MDERSKLISKLQQSFETRTAYIKAKIGTLVPSQIRALRLQSEMPRQSDLASAAQMLQSRISMIETPGAANMTLDTLAKLASAFKVGVIVKFVPFRDMLRWENSYSQDNFDVVPRLDQDEDFLNPEPRKASQNDYLGSAPPPKKRVAAQLSTDDESKPIHDLFNSDQKFAAGY